MKPRIFLDTNVVIDYLAARAPFGEAAYRIFLEIKILTCVFLHCLSLLYIMF